uniref:Galectin domain-containing protein n=1 Tax=Ursus maritimus TaxID=29073 RepID=A0A452UIQ5_URSMA
DAGSLSDHDDDQLTLERAARSRALPFPCLPKPPSFVLNLGKDSDNLCLHFNPRFEAHGDVNTIVCNSKDGALHLCPASPPLLCPGQCAPAPLPASAAWALKQGCCQGLWEGRELQASSDLRTQAPVSGSLLHTPPRCASPSTRPT